jgi:hypothetical protein
MMFRSMGVMMLGIVLGMGGVAYAGAAVVAKAAGVQVFSEPSDKSPVVGTMNAKDSAVCGERKGMFWEVTLGAKKGFVSILKVTRKTDDASGVAEALRQAAKDGRGGGEDVNAGRSRSAVMGVRGLGPSETASTAANVKPNLRMVYDMEDRVVGEAKMNDLANDIATEIEKRATGGRN